MASKKLQKNPQNLYFPPPLPAQEQDYPGLESLMNPRPEYGKDLYKGSGKLQDKVAIITGGDSGIGRSVAVLFAKEGADVVISYLSEEEDAQETKKVVEKTGRTCIAIPGDIQDKSHCETIIKRTIDEFGSLDILVNNAAYQKSIASILDITEEELERTFRTNIFAMFYLTQLAFPHMNAGGSVINTSSIQAYKPSPSLLSYAATKAAIINFTRGFAKEAIKKGIRVNAVAPGPVWTPLIPATLGKSSTPEFGKKSLFGRTAQPIELAPIFVFLASQDASFVTGQTYGATGAGMP